jgi:tRNA G18 (ribose-2'-O)-methylase SpoU
MNEQTNGVGPHPLPWPNDSRFDPELLENGDRRNVEDQYRYWTVEAIKAVLDKTRHDFHIAIENLQHDFNIGTIVRSANAFNAGAVHIIGKRQWNKRGAMVTDRYLDVFYHPTIADFQKSIKDRAIIVVDNVGSAGPLSKASLPEHCVLVFGGEGPGVSDELCRAADQIVMIEQFGSTRSVNVGVAAGIVMYEWLKQNVL